MDMDISQYKELFISEAQEHLEALNQSMVDLEKDPGNPDVLTEIFRSAHTLKGMSATMGFDQMTDLSHEMENVLDGLRSGDIEANTDTVDLLFNCFDVLGAMVAAIAEESGRVVDTRTLTEALRAVYAGEGRGPAGAERGARPPLRARLAEGILAASARMGEEEEAAEEEPEAAGAPGEMVSSAGAAVLERAAEEQVLPLQVTLESDCILKSVRVFMIFKKLSQMGRVISSRPSIEDLEDEKFERSFETAFVTRESMQAVRSALLNIAEVQDVRVLIDEAAEPITEEREAGRAVGPEAEMAADAADTGTHVASARTQSVRVNISRLDNLMNLIGELVINRTRLQEIASSHDIPDLRDALAHTSRLTAELQDEVMKTRMVPVEHIFNRFPRMVRDLAKSRGKEIEFLIEGKDIELDRTILDEISDPLMHLLRNAVDHGIDSPEERGERGKPRQGRIKLTARRDRNYVSIEVSDDGQGVDAEKVFDIAEKLGLMSREDRKALGGEDALRFLAMPGFSSSEEVSGISGRGVGLDVAKNKVESLGGILIMYSVRDQGTTFALKLPLTLAIIQALLVRVESEIYAIPLGVVAETAVISSHDIKHVSNQEVIFLRDETIPMMRLADYLGLTGGNGLGAFPVVVVEIMQRNVAVAVDELLGQQEIVITSLDRFLKGVRGFGGATILGTGEVALILDIPTLLS